MLSGLKLIEISALIFVSPDYSVYKGETITGQYSSVTYRLSEASAQKQFWFPRAEQSSGCLGKTLVFSLTVTLKILLTLNVWGFPPTSTNAPTIVMCPTTQFSVDTVYLNLVSDSTSESFSQSHQAPPISDAKSKSQVVTALLTGQL